jgi:adenylosuccinate synthase
MKTAAVLGMNYGDEGKGHIVNFLSSAETLVVRFNGGGQAAHAVNLADGRSHIFHHFGSGSLKGARTLLASHFILNPVIFVKELEQLHSLGAPIREVLIDPRCRVTTPYDMLVNEFITKTHGITNTCGVGINETVERSMFKQLRITARDLVNRTEDELMKTLMRIEGEYLPWRLDQIKLSRDDFKTFALEKANIAALPSLFIRGAKWMIEHSAVWEDCTVIDRYHAKHPDCNLVFEGGQGMLLDQSRDLEHGTRSSTGMKNVNELLKRLRTPVELTVYLVTRAYLTRHGAGKMMSETTGLPYPKISEPTNPENPNQGKMRYGYLSVNRCHEAIKEVGGNVRLAVTCIDQLDDFVPSEPLDSTLITAEKTSIRVRDLPSVGIISMGPNESDIVENRA